MLTNVLFSDSSTVAVSALSQKKIVVKCIALFNISPLRGSVLVTWLDLGVLCISTQS